MSVNVSEIIEYLKPRADWKFYNYLRDKATKYEDEGIVFFFGVELHHIVLFESFSLDTDQHNTILNTSAFEIIKKYYETEGLTYYAVVVPQKNDVAAYVINCFKEYIDDLNLQKFPNYKLIIKNDQEIQFIKK